MPGRMGRIDLRNPLVRHHRLAPDHWWIVLPGLDGGKFWYDIGAQAPCNGTLANMAAASGWRGTPRPGGWGHLLFDGTDDYVTTGHPRGLDACTQMTVSAWGRTTTTSSSSGGGGLRNLVSMEAAVGAASNNAWMLRYSPSGGVMQWLTIVGAGERGPATGAVTLNAWSHWVATYNSAATPSHVLYRDGAAVGTATGSGTLNTSVQPLVIGSASDQSSRAWQGNIDDVQVRPYALTAAEVRALYDESWLGYPSLLRRVGRPLGGSAAAILFRRNQYLRAGSRGAYV